MNEKTRKRLRALETARAKGVMLATTGEPGAFRVSYRGRQLEQKPGETVHAFCTRASKTAADLLNLRYAVIATPVDCQL
jgi:hypothetical protein